VYLHLELVAAEDADALLREAGLEQRFDEVRCLFGSFQDVDLAVTGVVKIGNHHDHFVEHVEPPSL
jgi:hypothetical protein